MFKKMLFIDMSSVAYTHGRAHEDDAVVGRLSGC